jgi:hypothetical protein
MGAHSGGPGRTLLFFLFLLFFLINAKGVFGQARPRVVDVSVAAKEWAISADQNGLGRHELMAAKLGPGQKSSKMCLDCSFFLARLASLAYEKRAIPGLRQSSWIKRAVEKDASRKSPEPGLSHFAWKSR